MITIFAVYRTVGLNPAQETCIKYGSVLRTRRSFRARTGVYHPVGPLLRGEEHRPGINGYNSSGKSYVNKVMAGQE